MNTRQIRRDDTGLDLDQHAAEVAAGRSQLRADARDQMLAAVPRLDTADDDGLFDCSDASDPRASRTGGPGALGDQVADDRALARAWLARRR